MDYSHATGDLAEVERIFKVDKSVSSQILSLSQKILIVNLEVEKMRK